MKHSAIWLAAAVALVLSGPAAFAAPDVCAGAPEGSVAEGCVPRVAAEAPAPAAVAPRAMGPQVPMPTPVAASRRSVVAAPAAPLPPYRAGLEARRCNSMLCPYYLVLGTGF